MVSRSTPSISAEMTLTPLIMRAWAARSSSFERAPLRLRVSSCLFELALGLLGALKGCGEIFFVYAQARGDFVQELARVLVIRESGNARDGFDAAHSGGGGLFDGNFEHADIAGAADVRAAAKFLAVESARSRGIGNRHDADVLFGVAVAEEGQRAGSERVVNRGDVGLNFGVEQDFVVHLLLDVAQFGGVNGGEVREVEAQAAGLDERAGLFHVRAENIAQRRVHQVRRRVIALDVLAARAVGVSRDAIAHGEFFFCHDAMRDQAGDRIIRAAHFGKLHRVLVVPKRADVGDLSAGFGVEHRAIEDDFAFRSRWQFVDCAILGDDGLDAAIFRRRIEIKIRLRAISFREFSIHRIRDVFVPAFP